MAEDNDDDISIDFSGFKNLFKRKTEKDKVKAAEVKVEKLEKEIKQSDDSKKIENDKKIVQEIKTELKKEEKEAAIIDGEKKLIDKKLEKHEKKLDKVEEDVDDDSVSFDFSRMKNFFKKKEPNKVEDSEDDMKVDYKSLFESVKKYSVVLLLLIPIIITIYLRVSPYGVPITDDWAKSSLINLNKNIITQQIKTQYPNLPADNMNKLVASEVDKLVKANEILIPTPDGIQKVPFTDAVKQYSEYYKTEFKQDNGHILPGDIDPYFWKRHAENVLMYGHPGDELRNPVTKELCSIRGKDCVPWDSHMYAPLGREVPEDTFYPYFLAYTHKFISIFNSKQTMLDTMLFIPVLLGAISIIPAFFIGRKISNNLGGFFAAMLIALHPAFLSRTTNSADTDALNIIFPLFITWFVIEAFMAKSWKKSAIMAAIAGFTLSIYSVAWGGWWYIFDFILAATIGYIVIYFIINRDRFKDAFKDNNVKNSLTVLATFFVIAMVFTIIFGGLGIFTSAFQAPLQFTKIKAVAEDTVWPNVFTTVAELNPASLDSIISQIGIGNWLLVFMAIIGILITAASKKVEDKNELYFIVGSSIWIIFLLALKPQNLLLFIALVSLPLIIKIAMAIYARNHEIDFKIPIILMIWLVSTIYASTQGVRFLLLLVPAFSIGAGVAVGYFYDTISYFLHKNLYLNKAVAKTVVATVLLILLLVFPVQALRTARSISDQSLPLINRAWYTSLDKINQNASDDAIINSWWDYGHWFKSIGNRSVTFDGASQDTPMAHWIGHSLLTDDEEDAVGVIRMLDCGSNTAFDKLDAIVKDTVKSVNILHEIVSMDKADAKKYLQQYISSTDADEILKYTHCDAPEDYFITSDDMISKSGVWAHFGIWDFNRALMYNTISKPEYKANREKSVGFLKERFNLSDQDAMRIYSEIKSIRDSSEANSWIASWPSYASNSAPCKTNNQTISCPFIVNDKSMQVVLDLRIDLKAKKAAVYADGKEVPSPVKDIVYPTKDGVDKIFMNNTMPDDSRLLAMTLIPDGDSWQYIIMQSPLEDSMFTRLYFLDGHGFAKFKKFSEESSITGNRIVVWKIDWDGKEKNNVYFQPKTLSNGTKSD